MLPFDQILPAISSLSELYSRPSSNARVASQNQKVGLVLRKKIVDSMVRGLFKQSSDAKQMRIDQNVFLSDEKIMTAILNMTLISSVGVDFSDLSVAELTQIRKLKGPALYNFLKKTKDAEGISISEYFWEGTEVNNKQKKTIAFNALYKKSKKSLEVSLQKLIKGIEKEVTRKSKKDFTGEFVSGDLTSEVIADILVTSLTGRDDTSDEETVFESAGLRKRMSAKSVFKIIFDEGVRFRKKVAKAEANGSLQVGQGAFTWAKRSKDILGIMRNFKYKMWRIVEKQIKAQVVSFSDMAKGEESLQEAQDRIVAESYTDLIDSMSELQQGEDTTERRATLVEARDAWTDNPDPVENAEGLKEYVLRVLDLINARTKKNPTKKDCRTLLDNIEVISGSNRAMYKKIRGLVYDRLFRLGQLESAEIQLLDGVFTENELFKEKKKISSVFDVGSFIANFDADFSLLDLPFEEINEIVDLGNEYSLTSELSKFESYLESLVNALKYAPNELYLKNQIAVYELLAESLGNQEGYLKDKVDGWLTTYANDADFQEVKAKFTPDEQQELNLGVSALQGISDNIHDLHTQAITLLTSKNAYKPIEDDEWTKGGLRVEGSHPLMSYSISDYPIALEKVDAGRTITNVSKHVVINTNDLRVFHEITEVLSQDESFNSEILNLNRQRELVNDLASTLGELRDFTSTSALKKIKDTAKRKELEDANDKLADETKRHLNGVLRVEFEEFYGGTLKEDQEAIFDAIDTLIKVPASDNTLRAEVTKIGKQIQEVFDQEFGVKMRQIYEDNMDGAIATVLDEVIKNEISPEFIRGTNEYRHRAETDRVKRFLKRESTMTVFQEASRERLTRGSSSAKAKTKQLAEAKAVASEAKINAESQGLDFGEACKEVGLTTNKKGEAVIKNVDDIPNLRKLLKKLSKEEQQRNVDQYLDTAKSMTEQQIEDKLTDLNAKINEALSAFGDRSKASILYSRVTSYLSRGFLNAKLKQAFENLKGFASDQIDAISADLKKRLKDVKAVDVPTMAKRDGITEADLRQELSDLEDSIKEQQKNLPTVKRFNKLLDDLREIYITQKIYNFEDRLGDTLKAEVNQEIEELTKQRDARIEELKAKVADGSITSEEANTLRLIESGEDDDFGRKLKRKYQYRNRGISEDKTLEIEQRGLSGSRTQYAPVVEQQEESLRESARKMVQQAINQNVSFDELGLGGELEGENPRSVGPKGVLGVADLKGLASRTRSLRKYTMLKKKYGEGNKFKRLLQADVDLRPLARVIDASPECFPSVNLATDFGLLKVYLALPSYPRSILVQEDGNFYTLKSQNVFADPFSERNIQALMRYLLASTNKLAISNAGSQLGADFSGVIEMANDPQLESFYENFLNSPSSDSFKSVIEQLDLERGNVQSDADQLERQESLERGEQHKDILQKYTPAQLLELEDASDEVILKSPMVKKVLGKKKLTEEDIQTYFDIAFSLEYYDDVNRIGERFFAEGLGSNVPVKDLLGAGLEDFLTGSEASKLSKKLYGTKDRTLITKDILGESYQNRITGATIANFTGLYADLNVLLACASSAVSLTEMANLNIDPDCVEKVREIFGAEIEELNEIVRKG